MTLDPSTFEKAQKAAFDILHSFNLSASKDTRLVEVPLVYPRDILAFCDNPVLPASPDNIRCVFKDLNVPENTPPSFNTPVIDVCNEQGTWRFSSAHCKSDYTDRQVDAVTFAAKWSDEQEKANPGETFSNWAFVRFSPIGVEALCLESNKRKVFIPLADGAGSPTRPLQVDPDFLRRTKALYKSYSSSYRGGPPGPLGG